MKKKIGISFSRTNFQFYWDWFTQQDLADDLELVLLSFEKDNVEDFTTCDAFVLTGGVDIHPSFYGGEATYSNQPKTFEIERDRFEKKIYAYSQQHRLPLLAICRGMQLVNIVEGGKLIPDLGQLNKRHRKEIGKDKTHAIRTEAVSLLAEVTGQTVSLINSAHHQAIAKDAIGNNLHPSGLSANDGVIEAIEFADKTGKAFMLGVQWHPERMQAKESHPFSQRLKERFLHEVRSVQAAKLSIINPATEEVVANLNVDTTESVSAKFVMLQAGQTVWQNLSLKERTTTLQKFSSLLQKNTESLAAILTSETGKPLKQAKNEIAGACKRIAWLTANAGKYLSDETMKDEDGLQEKIVYEPLGVVCNISAWNYPYLVGVNVFIPALLAGNAVLYKPSEYATLTGLQIEKYLKEAGLPDAVFQTAIGGGDVGEALLDLSFDGYFFTGSYKTGKHIYERVAPKMVPCQCELGGKDPLYVADDVEDIKAVAAATADGAFYNNGQSCCAVERIYVHEKIYDDYVDAFVNEVKSYKTGLPTDDGIYIGPLTRQEQVSLLVNQVDDAIEKGASLLVGGEPADRKGYYFEPTVLADVTQEMTVMKDESFGPIIGIAKVSSDEEAVEKMSDTEYGLTASVYSNSEQRAVNILQQLNTGTGYWNCCDRVSPAVPWSGRKHSGFGSTLSSAGLRAFTKPKAYHLIPGPSPA